MRAALDKAMMLAEEGHRLAAKGATLQTHVKESLSEMANQLTLMVTLLQGFQLQPIESAPKDRRVLLYFPTLFNKPMFIFGHWEKQEMAKRPRPYWTCDMEYVGVRALRDNQPTHWLPSIEKLTT